MSLHQRVVAGLVSFAAVAALGAVGDEGGPEVPAPFAPFEYLAGGWKGTGRAETNKVRGWPETHSWAWRFEKGVPVGMTVTMNGGKVLAEGRLTFDDAAKRYTLEGTDPAGKPVTFQGALDKAGKTLTLDRAGATSQGARQRLTLYPNSGLIRYTLKVSEREGGSPQYRPALETGLTKEGEVFAATDVSSERPKCVVTGGASTLRVSYQGKSYPLCCTGCRDEFNENPEKYVKKASLRAETPAPAPAEAKAEPRPAADARPKPEARPAMAKAPAKAATPAAKSKAAVKLSASESRAASVLKLGQDLETSGKTDAALRYYRRVVKDFPDTPAAGTAAERVKALGKP